MTSRGIFEFYWKQICYSNELGLVICELSFVLSKEKNEVEIFFLLKKTLI